jgi:hypothetical protein
VEANQGPWRFSNEVIEDRDSIYIGEDLLVPTGKSYDNFTLSKLYENFKLLSADVSNSFFDFEPEEHTWF